MTPKNPPSLLAIVACTERQERTGLAALVELSERLSLVRAEALHLLGRN